MLPMRRQMPPLTVRAGRATAIGLLVLGALALAGGPAHAQATTPPPPLGAGDTAPPPGAPPAPEVEPVAPLPELTPPPSSAVVTAPALTAPPPRAQQQPIYRKDWFWAAIGVVLMTGAVVMFFALRDPDPATPPTRLGDMRAF
jgi:hypothetical protein